MSDRINKISIIGLGLIGGSIAKALKSSKLEIDITALDKDEILLKAIEEKSIDRKIESVIDSVAADIIFLCLPVEHSLQYLKQLAPLLKENQIITDVSGIKGIFQREWEKLNSAGTYIGGHPMTGKEKGGYQNSDPLLFENSVYILSDRSKEYDGIDSFTNIIESLGARITFLNPYLHDKVVANVSHLPQLLSISLVNNSAKKEGEINFSDFAAGGFRDMTRIAASDFLIWEKIIAYNKDEILAAINSLKNELGLIENFVAEDDFNSLAEKFESSRIKRDEIPKDTKGFLTKLHDLFVFVRDEPGVVSKISTALFNNDINIKDIELLKIREGTGGTFRLSFDSEQDVKRAGEIIRKEGFEIK